MNAQSKVPARAPVNAPVYAPNRDIREVVREEPLVHGRILEVVKSAPSTVPEIAAAIGMPAHEVVVWVMGMRRYGWLSEVKGATDDGYFRYEWTGRTS